MNKGIIQRLMAGVLQGMVWALLLSAMSGVVILIVGPEAFRSRYGFTFISFLEFFFASGAVCGPVAGMLSPLTRTRDGAAAVGFAACVPLFTFCVCIFSVFIGWTLAAKTALVLICSLLTGPVCGLAIRAKVT